MKDLFQEYQDLMYLMLNCHASPYIESEIVKFDAICGRIEEIEQEHPEFEEKLYQEEILN